MMPGYLDYLPLVTLGALTGCIAFKLVFGLVTGGCLGPVKFCPECGFEGQGKIVLRGSLRLEILLWLLGIFPGIAYSVWRVSATERVCSRCYHRVLLPVDSLPAQDARRAREQRIRRETQGG